jgi:hypothetical protein
MPPPVARTAVRAARTERIPVREAAVFLLLMPAVIAFINGWAQTNEGISFTRVQSVVYWLAGALPLWWLNAVLTRVGTAWAPLARGPGFWAWATVVPVLVFVAMGLVGFFIWRWEWFANLFLGSVPPRNYPATASVDWFIWMLKGSVVPIVLWIAALQLQGRIYGRTPVQPLPVATQLDVATAQAIPDFLKRLERPLAGELFAVQAQEHYIRVVGTDQAPLLLYRFSDALEQLKPRRGLQVHRSWWVNLDAVDGIERDGARMSLRLRNSERVPVSRRYMGAVEAAVDASGR